MSETLEPGRAALEPSPGLSALVAPIEVDRFRAEYLERAHVHIPAGAPGKPVPLDLADVDTILAQSSIRSADLRVVADGRETPVAELAAPGDATALELLYDCYRKGSTVVMKFLDERWPPLRELCSALAADLDARIQVNVYLTPPGARGLTPHFDTHDVFVVQVSGSKHWRIYDSPYPLPMHGQSYARHRTGPDPGEPVDRFVMRPGDVFYMPRGCVHDATSGDEASLHLTIGVLPVLWASVVRDAVATAVERDERLRRAVPAGAFTDPDARAAATSALVELLDLVRSLADPAELLDRAARVAEVGRRPDLRGHLLDLEAVRSLDGETTVRRREQVRCAVEADTDQIHLRFHGKRISLPARVGEQVRYISAARDPFTPRDLPGGLDSPGRVVLVETLVREGLLTVG
ncbi:cupin domain-containing protein [Actinokineospora terrae]|uniref:Cupin superfamily protein n=1 Tax=Actinokineospora terrae TaxID=155974 RepID=A0A1H9VHJ6_9PSEU|nr:cupin domain-containing protein [Actinokineospora terrae]SES21049.1 Cupin superfamily protein [Actinokineospora terrae]